MPGMFHERHLLTSVKDATTSAGTGDITSDSVDMAGYEGVFFFASYGTAASNNLPNAETSSDDGVADSFTDLAGTEVGVGSSDEEVWLEIHRPVERYVKAVFARGTSTTLGNIWAIRYGGRTLAEDNTVSGTIFGEGHASPAEGTK